MPRDDKIRSVVREWIAKVDNDLKNAVHTLKMEEECPTDTVCFHARQCVEKYLKALLVFHGIDFSKTHDLEVLVRLLGKEKAPHLTDEEQAALTDFSTGARYPGWGDISLSEAKNAMETTERVQKEVRSTLPPAFLSEQ